MLDIKDHKEWEANCVSKKSFWKYVLIYIKNESNSDSIRLIYCRYKSYMKNILSKPQWNYTRLARMENIFNVIKLNLKTYYLSIYHQLLDHNLSKGIQAWRKIHNSNDMNKTRFLFFSILIIHSLGVKMISDRLTIWFTNDWKEFIFLPLC